MESARGNKETRQRNERGNEMSNANRTMVSVPKALKERLDKLAGEMLVAYENGQSNVELTEQGTRGVWVSLATVIEKCLDEYESHRERSRNGNGRKAIVTE